MFVRASKYKQVKNELTEAKLERLRLLDKVNELTQIKEGLQIQITYLERERSNEAHKRLREDITRIHRNTDYDVLQDKYNEAMITINQLRRTQFDKQSPQFTDAELKSLIQLVHPDKHNGKESAHRWLQRINQLRG